MTLVPDNILDRHRDKFRFVLTDVADVLMNFVNWPRTATVADSVVNVDDTVAVACPAVVVDFVVAYDAVADSSYPDYRPTWTSVEWIVLVVSIVVEVNCQNVATVDSPFRLRYGHVLILVVCQMDRVDREVMTKRKWGRERLKIIWCRNIRHVCGAAVSFPAKKSLTILKTYRCHMRSNVTISLGSFINPLACF